jgi:endonuclease YncB( thermonuclease family)
MRRVGRGTVAFLVALGVLLIAGSGFAQIGPAKGPIPAYVSRVVDGDTIYVVIGNRSEAVRYIGITTPEMHHARQGRDPYGEAAYAANQRLVDAKWIWLVFDVEQRDRYGRLLAYVWVDGRFVNAELVRNGYAQATTSPPNVRYAEHFQSLEHSAREGNRGLWALADRVEARPEDGARQTLPRLKSEAIEATTATSRAFSAPMPRNAPIAKSGSDRRLNVRGYWRDGVWVAPHTRSLPD